MKEIDRMMLIENSGKPLVLWSEVERPSVLQPVWDQHS
jgi:hypothetical protein